MGAHGAVASYWIEQPTIDAVFADWRSAPVRPELRAMLGFVEQLTLAPNDIGAAEIAALRAAGLPDQAIEDAAYVCAMFSTITRLADAFDWDVPAEFEGSKVSLVKFGYKLPPGM